MTDPSDDVRQLHAQRFLADAIEDTEQLKKSIDEKTTIKDEALVNLITKLDVARSALHGNNAKPIGNVLGDALNEAGKRLRGKGKKPAPLPFGDLQEALQGGLWPGVHVLVGGTGAGKSTLAIQLAIHAAQEGHPVAYVGLELDREQVALRLAAHMAQIPWSSLVTKPSEDHLDAASLIETNLARLPIVLDSAHAHGWSAGNLRTVALEVKKLTKEHPDKTPLIIVDYLQLVASDTMADNRDRVGRAAYEAHAIASDMKAAVLLISSVARHGYGITAGDPKKVKEAGARLLVDTVRIDGREHLGDRLLYGSDALVGLGKESGEIEFAATSVMTMIKTRPKDDESSPERIMALALPKNRFGPSTWIPLVSNESFSFSEGKQTHAIAVEQRLKGESSTKDKPSTHTTNGKSESGILNDDDFN